MIVVAIIGILAAIAIPNFIKFQARSKQSEAKANLKAMFTAEKAYIQEKDAYNTLINIVGFAPERNNRYAYFLSNTGTLQDRSGSTITSAATDQAIAVDTFRYAGTLGYAKGSCGSGPNSNGDAGVSGTTPGPFDFTGLARGNIDTDTTIDMWSISTASRTFSATVDIGCSVGGNNPSGEPANEINDVNF
jgi:type IV pilus assembly protein PilA